MGEEHYQDRTPADGPAPEKGGGGGKTVIIVVICVLGAVFCLCVPLIAAIAIPNLMEARKHGNEAAAIGALRTLTTSQEIYREADRDGNGVSDYGDLKALGRAKLIDQILAGRIKQGYNFTCKTGSDPQKTWWALAEPIVPGKTGERYFFTNQTGVVYYSNNAMTIDEETGDPPANAVPMGQ